MPWTFCDNVVLSSPLVSALYIDAIHGYYVGSMNARCIIAFADKGIRSLGKSIPPMLATYYNHKGKII